MTNQLRGRQEAHLQSALQLAPIGAFLADLEGNCFFVNREWEKISGLTAKESQGKGWMNIIVKEDIPAVAATLKNADSSPQEPHYFSYRIIHPQQGMRYCEVIARYFTGTSGENCFLGYVQDVTLQKEAERKQSELTTHLQSLIASLEDIVFEIDGNQVFLNVWVHDESKLYMPREAFLGKSIGEVLGPQALVFSRLLADVMDSGEEREIVYRHWDSSINQWFKARAKPVVKNPDPAACIMIISIADVTAQKIAELSLRETKYSLELSNQLLDVSQQLSQTGGWEYNLQTGEVFWTKHTYLIYDVDESFKPNLENSLQFFLPDDRALLNRFAGEAIRDKKPYDLEVRVVTAKNVQKWLRAIGVPVEKDGEVVMIRGALMDITQKKAGELDLIAAKNFAEDAARAKADFLSIMSHEIRTPLNGIIGIANLLQLNHAEDQKEYVSNLIFSADHLLQLINDILDLNKIERDQFEMTYSVVNLHELVRNIHNQFKSLADAKKIRLVSEIDGQIPKKVNADVIRLSQILNNLTSNAIHYTEKGDVTISLQLVKKHKEKVNIHFSVKDTGVGIPEKYHGTVFESFRQVEQPGGRKHAGTGLGLTITQKLIELHKSKISLDSKPGKGTEFYFDILFDLPTKKNRPPERAKISELSAYERKFKGMRLLFVEDNQINVMVAKRQLEYFGVQPDCALNGTEAVMLLNENKYDVAFIDLHMPEMDGYELSELIRKEYPEVHIVIFTADIMPEVRRKFARRGIFDILNKPFFPREMLSTLLKIAQVRKLEI